MAAQLEREERHRSQESFPGHPSGLQITVERKLDEEIGKPATSWGLAQLCDFFPLPLLLLQCARETTEGQIWNSWCVSACVGVRWGGKGQIHYLIILYLWGG